MDLNPIRAGVTLVGFVLFLALVLHTWSRRRRNDHEAAARLPFGDDEILDPPAGERRE